MFPEIDIYFPTLNFVSRMRLDPVGHLLSQLLPPQSVQGAYIAWQFFVLFLGMYFLLANKGVSLKNSVCASFLVPVSILACLGFHPFFLSMHWFPLFLASLLSLEKKLSSMVLLICILSAVLWIISSASLGVFGGVLALFVWAISKADGDSKEARKGTLSLLIGLFAVVFSVLLLPHYPMPEYPGGARLAPIGPLYLYERPLIGPLLEPNPIVYSEYLRSISEIAWSFAALAVLWSVVLLFSDRSSFYRALPILVVSFLIGAGEALVPSQMGIYAPFPTLSRIIPGLSIAGLPWLLFPFGLVLAVFSVRSQVLLKTWSLLLTLSSLLLLYKLAFERGVDLRNIFVDAKTAISDRAFAIAHSPSGHVADVHGSWVSEEGEGERRRFDSLQRLLKEVDFAWSVEASPLNDEAGLAVDGSSSTRWRTGRPQRVGDFYRIYFDSPVSLVRVVLSIQETPTDFPRGISVRAGKNKEEAKEVLRQPDWLGGLRWTSSGYPFFGSQSEVVIDLPTQQEIGFLEFIQIGKSNHFDWSINEIKLYRFK